MNDQKGISTATMVYNDYYAEYGHVLYKAEARNHSDEPVGQLSCLLSMFEQAGIEDGDEFELIIRKTGNRPFDGTRIELVAPHTYERVRTGTLMNQNPAPPKQEEQ